MSLWRAFFSISFFVACLLTGWALRRRGWMTQARAEALIHWLIQYPAPLVLGTVLWGVRLDSWRMLALPLMGAGISASMLLPAYLYSRVKGLNRPQTGSMLVSAFFSNLGYLGAFTAFALYGEEAYGLGMLYLLFFSPCFYTLGFWIGGHYGRLTSRSPKQPALAEDYKFYPLVGMLIGLALNLSGVPRPEVLGDVNQVLIPAHTALYLVAIGSQLTFRPASHWVSAGWVMSAIKFIYAPAVAWCMVQFIGLEGLPRFVVLLQASTPVGVSAMIFPMLFRLDRELANALWLITTLLAVPWLLAVIPILQRL